MVPDFRAIRDGTFGINYTLMSSGNIEASSKKQILALILNDLIEKLQLIFGMLF